MEKAILKTLVYSDIFNYPLKKDEIWRWLIWEKEKGNEKEKGKAKKEDFEKALEKLLKNKKCRKKKDFYFLTGREEIVGLREQREKYSKPKIKKAKEISLKLSYFPWIKLIGLTGALASENAEEDSDLDLFFIVSRNRLWLTRGIIVFFLLALGLYRRPKSFANKVCPNMFVAEDNLKMIPQDLFTAHEICLLKPLIKKGHIYQKFLGQNYWVREFLPNAANIKKIQEKKKNFTPLFFMFDWLESLARGFQVWYMRGRRTNEIVEQDLIKFHPKDVRRQVLESYKRELGKLRN